MSLRCSQQEVRACMWSLKDGLESKPEAADTATEECWSH